MSKEIDTKIECCEIWNSLKDKTKMIDFLINAKTEIDQLKQENEKLFLQLSKQEIDEHKPVYCTLAGNDCKYLGKIKELKQQLSEKDKEIKKLNWQLKDKDFIIKNLNHSLSVAPNANAGQRARIDELTKIVKEKDKEIEDLSLQIANLNSKITQMEEQDMVFHNQLAIQELEKVKDWLNEPFDEDGCFKIGGDLIDFIDQQINDLRGEKDERI